jgi:hypothetical protein
MKKLKLTDSLVFLRLLTPALLAQETTAKVPSGVLN